MPQPLSKNRLAPFFFPLTLVNMKIGDPSGGGLTHPQPGFLFSFLISCEMASSTVVCWIMEFMAALVVKGILNKPSTKPFSCSSKD